jgi:hypothetical protein
MQISPFRPGSEERDRGLELLLGLPELGHVVSRCYGD